MPIVCKELFEVLLQEKAEGPYIKDDGLKI